MLFGLYVCSSAFYQAPGSISVGQHFPDAFSLNQPHQSLSPASRSNVAAAVTILWEIFWPCLAWLFQDVRKFPTVM